MYRQVSSGPGGSGVFYARKISQVGWAGFSCPRGIYANPVWINSRLTPIFTTVWINSRLTPIFPRLTPIFPIFTNIHQYSPIFTNIHQYSPIFTNIHQYSPIFNPNIQPQYSPIFNIPQYSPIFPIFPIFHPLIRAS